jgi:hypothetical protein
MRPPFLAADLRFCDNTENSSPAFTGTDAFHQLQGALSGSPIGYSCPAGNREPSRALLVSDPWFRPAGGPGRSKETAMRDTLACGNTPGGGRDPEATTYLVVASLLELFALVDDGPAALAAGTIAWVLMLRIELGEY